VAEEGGGESEGEREEGGEVLRGEAEGLIGKRRRKWRTWRRM
jgi:hypothetical protein